MAIARHDCCRGLPSRLLLLTTLLVFFLGFKERIGDLQERPPQTVKTKLHDATKSSKQQTANSKQQTANSKFPSYCESMETNLKQLRSRLHSDPQSSALRNVVVQDSTGTNHSIPGLTPELIEEVFVGHRIFLMGDSTLYYPMKWLYRLLEYHFSHSGADLSNQTLDEGNRKINPDMDQQLHLKGNPPPYVNSSTHTNIRWMGFSGPSPNSCDLSTIWQKMIQQHQPTVMVVNMGLHWLHFAGIARDPQPCVVDRWIHYEDFLQEALDAAASSNTTRLVLFKTTNFICSSKYRGEYAKADQSFSAVNNTNALDKCQQAIAKAASKDRTTVLAEKDIQTYCRHGTFNEVGSDYLNQRLRQFVQQQQQKPSNKVSISIFNDHDVESCPYTGTSDGRHYHPLNLLRIRMLGNMLACYDV
jgi:hypothetical protein